MVKVIQTQTKTLIRYFCCPVVIALVLLTLNLQVAAGQSNSVDDDDDTFQFIRGQVPEEFTLGSHYPARNETEECRPIRLRIVRNSHQFRTTLVTNNNPDITFSDTDARVMTSRLQTRLNELAASYFDDYSARITVLKAWVEYGDDDGIDDPYSLHYEGRTVRVRVNRDHISDFLKLAVTAGFDWVLYASHDYVRLSVIPDVCSANLDLVFMLDQSGSVGPEDHDIALEFLQDVVSFYTISTNATQVGLITFSSGAKIEFQLDEHTDITSLQTALSGINYTGGWTTTALALFLAQLMLNPSRGYGARPSSSGTPKIAVLLTDGRSNIYPINEIAPLLRNSGVQVYTVGIGNVYLEELKFIASDPDPLHVFLLNSFADAPDFVDFLSFTACDTPAIVEPGDNTTTEVEEDGFRFFQSECPAFSMTIMIEQIDLVGTCSLYASTVIQNPGPLDPHGVVRNEDRQRRKRSVHLHRTHLNRFIYWSVRGLDIHNQFSVIIWDMIFQEDSYTVFVPEGISGAVVFNLNDALRMTNVSFTYTISSGDESNHFLIDPLTGDILTFLPLDADLQDSFSLMIVAQNSNYSCHRGRVMIEVIVTRDQIEFPSLPTVSISEDATPGTPVTQVQVIGSVSSVSYSIIGGNVGNAFTINATTGDVQVLSPLNFETLDSYSLTIQATSSVTGNTGTAVQVVNIADVNEEPFFVTGCAVASVCMYSVMETAGANTPVGTVVAGDPDRPTTLNGMIDFSIDDSVPFTVVQTGTTAEIQTSSSLPEDVFSFVFNLIVSDRGTPSLSASTTITVQVNDVNNNAPVFTQAPEVLSVLESAGDGMFLTQYVAMDADQGTNGEIIYSLSSSQSPIPFEINSTTGFLTVSGSLDFEQLNFYTITVTASNPDGLQSTSVQTFITLLDVNDNPPIFMQETYTAEVEEHSLGGTVVRTVTATDLDSGPNGQIDFAIISGNIHDAFSINSLSPGIGLITVSTNADINREVIQVFDLTVTATDRGTPQMSDTAHVFVMVTDINDNPPNFLPDTYEASLREDIVPPLNFLSVFVFDLDEPATINTQVDFEITDGNVGDAFAIVRLDDNTASLHLIGNLSFEMQPSYVLTLTATDRGTNPGPQSSTATVNISVLDVNIRPPVVSGNQTIEVSESAAVGTQIALVNATDEDSTEILYNIVSVVGEGVIGDAMGFFSISDEGVVSLAERLDFEISSRYEIEIEVTDGTLTTTATLVVIVLNENETPPEITTLTFSVLEEQPNGTIVGTVLATDLDADPSETIMFAIINNQRASSLFSIERDTGVLRTTQVLDRESLVLSGLFLPESGSTENLTIQAIDEGTPRLTSRTEISVTLIDINDNAPAFMIQNNSIGAVFENKMAEEVVLNAVALDSDLGESGMVSYSLEILDLPPGVADPFVITQKGLVRTTMSLDREERETYSVIIRATDSGVPQLSSDVFATITILDVNDNAPNFTQSVYSMNVLETTPTPVDLLQVTASDADMGSHADVTYSIVTVEPVSSLGFFSINNNTGEITLEVGLDFETTNFHTITVKAEDGGNPPLSSTALVEITVVNVDEIPPEFIAPCAVLVRESVSPGTPITLCIATDVDDTSPIPGVAVMYEFLEGNVGGAFSISNDGTVSVDANVDRETLDFYSILVRATDPVGLSTDTILNVSIADVNDNAPIITNLPANRAIAVSRVQSHVTTIFTVEATDADIGLNAELVYSLGTVTQFPGDRTTNITIQVSDRGDSPMMTSDVLRLFFEEPCTLQQYSINSTTGVITSELVCSIEVTPSVADVTIGTGLVLSCPIVRNTPVDYTWLHNGTVLEGPIGLNESSPTGQFVISSATFQDAGEYTCRVGSAIGNILSMPALVRIQVPPSINVAPMDTSVEPGRIVSFRCFASGIPMPTISWGRLNQDESVVVLNQTDRIFPLPNFLTIDNVQAGDQGTYVCTASNTAGETMTTANLILFGLSSVVSVQVMDFSMANLLQTCHELNTTQFEDVMTGITGVTTMVTGQNGDNLCDQTACSPSPCRNGGSCDLRSNDPTGLGYACTCPVGFTGVNCETDVNECNETPCLSGGTCTNTMGSFTCSCTLGNTGHRCQYSDICDSQPCPADQRCVATISNSQGYVCAERSDGGVVVTTGGATAGMLDDQVNSLQEIQQETNTAKRRKRQSDNSVTNNGYVTLCEARFVIVDSTAGQYLLVWACPEGVEPPTGSELDEICSTLFTRRLVDSCKSPNGLSKTNSGNQLPPTTLSISFILVSSDGTPLSGGEVLTLLTQTAALEALRAQGYQATNFTAAVPPKDKLVAVPEGMIIGVVVAVVVAVSMAALIFCIIVCVVRQRNSKKRVKTFDNSHTLHPLDSNSHDDSYVTSSYVSLHQFTPSEQTFTFIPPTHDSSVESPSTKPSSQEALFDNDIYGKRYTPPTIVQSQQSSETSNGEVTRSNSNSGAGKRRGSTLKRAAGVLRGRAPSLKRRTESKDNLLDVEDSGDYDSLENFRPTVTVTSSGAPTLPAKGLHKEPRMTPTAGSDYNDEVIYGNLQHTQVGAHGNAGERWESYWKTHTLLRSPDSSHDHNHKMELH